MSDPTPPFSALRALEAAARHRSFTWAARELKISHSAVSQAVRRLEAELGTRLFERRGGAMEPSEAARRLAESYSLAAQQLTGIIRDITGDEPGAKLTVSMPEEVADLWFAGRRARLSEALPDVEVSVTARRPGAGGSDVELVLTPKLTARDQALAEVIYMPLCAPSLAETISLETPDDLLSAPLLGDGSEAWTHWIARYAPGRRPSLTLCRDTSAMIDVALAGGGVAIAHQLVAQPLLATGELGMPPFPAPGGRTVALRSRAVPSKAETVERFTMWLKLELARDAAQLRRLPAARRNGEPGAARKP